MDVFADALVAVSDALDISRYGAGNSCPDTMKNTL